MKKINLIILALVVLGIAGVQAGTSNWHRITMTLVNQQPDPVDPGDYVDVRIKIENLGLEKVDNVDVTILPEYPFSLNPGEEQIKSLGTIFPSQTGDSGEIKKFKLRVDKNAVEGSNILEFGYRVNGGGWTKKEFSINIQTADAILSIEEVKVEPERVMPGEVIDLKITIENLADSLLKDINTKLLVYRRTQLTTSVNIDELPFTPVGTSDEKTILKLDSGEKRDIEFKLKSDADAEAKTYKIPVQFIYKDELAKNYTKDLVIGITLGAEPDLSVVLDETTIFNAGQTGQISVKFVNKDAVDVKFLNVKLEETDDYKVMSTDEYYIGDIDSDDYETADFKINAKQTSASDIPLVLKATYKDSTGEKYEKEFEVKLKFLTGDEQKNLGVNKGNPAIGIIIVIVILVAGFIAYRMWKKRRK